MRFYPRNRKSRHDDLVGPSHIAQGAANEDELTRRDRLHRYAKGNDASLSGLAAVNESDVVNGPVKASGTLTLTPGAIADDVVKIGTTYYQFAAAAATGAGTLASPYIVKVGASDTIALATLRKAINATGVAGTDYSAGLVVHATVTATASDATTLTVQAKTAGTAANAISTTVTATGGADGFAWGATTLAGGYDGIVLALTVSGDDKWQNDAISAHSAALIAAFPATDGLQAALSAGNFALSAADTVLTVTFPAIGAYAISGNASYDLSFAKECFKNAHAAVALTGAITVVNGA